MKLSNNFTWSEVINWMKWHPTITKKEYEAITLMMGEDLTDDIKKGAQNIVDKGLQPIRDKVNAQFPEYGGKIGIRPLSWWRPKRWEILRKRSGGSQHVFGHGVDFIVTGVKSEDYDKIMLWIWNDIRDWNGGLARLYKNKRWSFIHIDLGKKRRWEY